MVNKSDNSCTMHNDTNLFLILDKYMAHNISFDSMVKVTDLVLSCDKNKLVHNTIFVSLPHIRKRV
jgi:hypothetical protein